MTGLGRRLHLATSTLASAHTPTWQDHISLYPIDLFTMTCGPPPQALVRTRYEDPERGDFRNRQRGPHPRAPAANVRTERTDVTIPSSLLASNSIRIWLNDQGYDASGKLLLRDPLIYRCGRFRRSLERFACVSFGRRGAADILRISRFFYPRHLNMARGEGDRIPVLIMFGTWTRGGRRSSSSRRCYKAS